MNSAGQDSATDTLENKHSDGEERRFMSAQDISLHNLNDFN